jgi:hypothetical protein
MIDVRDHADLWFAYSTRHKQGHFGGEAGDAAGIFRV